MAEKDSKEVAPPEIDCEVCELPFSACACEEAAAYDAANPIITPDSIPSDDEIIAALTALGGRTDALSLGNALIALGYRTSRAQLGMQRAGDRGIIEYAHDWTIVLPAKAQDDPARRTFAMIKPDATERGVEGEMLTVIQQAGFRILELRRTRLERADAEWLYREHAERSHFSDLVDYTISGDVVLLHLQYPSTSAATAFRKLMGATDRTKADPGTLRALFAVGYRENSIHGSDSPEAALEELGHFFPQRKPTPGAFWPCAPCFVDCDPTSVAAIMIRAACNDAPYGDDDLSENQIGKSAVTFWEQVSTHADRIASWAVQGLGIVGRAQVGGSATPTGKAEG